MTDKQDCTEESLGDTLESRLDKLQITGNGSNDESPFSDPSPPPPPTLLCDVGFGIPKEARPRREKILALSRQLVNFLQCQLQACQDEQPLANVVLVGGSDAADDDAAFRKALMDRMHQLWKQESHALFPKHVSFASEPLESYETAIYLSPDADEALDTSKRPPHQVVVGMLIDRRTIQVNRSKNRADTLQLPCRRWPLETVSDVLHANEPLNVDCVLEGMQQWHWNYYERMVRQSQQSTSTTPSQCFERAAVQALRHHQERHPNRPQHKTR